jgi:hypothetical protein
VRPSPGKNPSTQRWESSAAWCEIRCIGAIKKGEDVTGNKQGVADEIEKQVRRGCCRCASSATAIRRPHRLRRGCAPPAGSPGLTWQ